MASVNVANDQFLTYFFTVLAPQLNNAAGLSVPTTVAPEYITVIDESGGGGGTDNTISLSQDYGSVGRFKIPTNSPLTTKILIYKSTDYVVGNVNATYLVNSTGVDAAGNWVLPTLTVPHGTYHVIQSITNVSTTVLAADMVV